MRKLKKKPLAKKRLNPKNDLKNWDNISDNNMWGSSIECDDFHGCCGLKIIAYLPFREDDEDYTGEYTNPQTGHTSDDTSVPLVVLKKWVEEDIKSIIEDDIHEEGIIITLNSLQIPKLQSVLYRCGFKRVVKPFLHRGHGRDVAVYFHPPKEGRKLTRSRF